MADLVNRFLQVEGPKRAPGTLKLYRRLLATYVLPSRGQVPLAKLTRAHVADFHEANREKEITANRALELLRAILYFAAGEGLIERNPASGVTRYPEPKTSGKGLTRVELRRLGKALSDDRWSWQAVAAIRLLLATGCRKTESRPYGGQTST